jgi:hypothetical protein
MKSKKNIRPKKIQDLYPSKSRDFETLDIRKPNNLLFENYSDIHTFENLSEGIKIKTEQQAAKTAVKIFKTLNKTFKAKKKIGKYAFKKLQDANTALNDLKKQKHDNE